MDIFRKKARRQTIKEAPPEKSKISRLLFFFLAVAFGGVVTYVFLFSPLPRIETIIVSGTKIISDKDVSNFTQEILGGKYGGIVPRNNLVLAAGNKIEGRLLDNFRRAEKMTVKKIFPHTLWVEVAERRALLIWCVREKCFLVDERGTAYAEADFESAEIRENNLVILIDEGGNEILSGTKIMDADFASFLIGLRERLRNDLGIEIKKEYRTPRTISGDVRAETEKGWKIFFNRELGIGSQLETLGLILNKTLSEEQVEKLEYVDLRTENKVYYKLRDEEKKEEAPASESASSEQVQDN